MDIPTPRPHSRRVSSLKDSTELNRWASDIDTRIIEILQSLRETSRRVNVLTTKSTPGSIGAHAPQHYPQTGFDKLLTAAHTVANGFAATVGTSDNLLRADAVFKHPDSLGEFTSNSLLTLTANSIDQTLTGAMGQLSITSGDQRIRLNNWTGFAGNGVVGQIMTFVGNTTTLGVQLTKVISAQGTWNDAGGVYTATTNQGLFLTVNQSTGPTYTNVNFHAAFIQIIQPGTFGASVNSWTERTVLSLSSPAPPLGAGVTVTDMYIIKAATWPTLGAAGTYTNARGMLMSMPIAGNTIRRGIEISSQTQNFGLEPISAEMIYLNTMTRGSDDRKSIHIAGHTAGSTPVRAYGVFIAGHTVGADKWSLWADNKCSTLSDWQALTAGKGLLVKDAQGTAEYWRIYPSVSGATLKDAIYSVDANGILSVTRAASATGTVILNIQDVGTAAPAQ